PVAPIRRIAAPQTSDEPLASYEVTKGYEFAKDQFVTLEPEELKALTAQTSAEMEVLEFVKLSEVDPVYFDTSYYVRPAEVGEKPYALLFEALKRADVVGIARLAMHRREHFVILRPGNSGLIAHTMFFRQEIRADQEYNADPTLVARKELDMAKLLI